MLSLLLLLVLAALTLLGGSSAQVLSNGTCPAITLVDNFAAQRFFTGRWYEQRRLFAIFELGQKCSYADYAIAANGTVSVTNSGFHVRQQQRKYANGTAYCETSRPAYCHVRFNPGSPYGDYKVLATDYDNYALIFSCTDLLRIFNLQFAWLLTRQKTVSDQLIADAYQIFAKNGIATSHFITTVQDCSDN